MSDLKPRHGVLDLVNEVLRIYLVEQGKLASYVVTDQLQHLGDLCQIAVDYRVTTLWVLLSCAILPDVNFVRPARQFWDIRETWDVPDEIARQTQETQCLTTAVAIKLPKGGQPMVTVCFPEYGQCEWATEELTPELLLQIIACLEHVLGIPVGNSPATVGMKYLQKVNGDHPQWLAALPSSMNIYSFPWEGAASDIIWSRPLEPIEQVGKYLHAVDKNYARARACTEEMFGMGELEHVESFDYKSPGIWRVTVENRQGRLLPPPLWNNAGKWLATPIVKVIEHMGNKITVHEGWAFPEYHYTLRTWAEYLWQVRNALRKPADNPKLQGAYDLLRGSPRQMVVSTIGLFGYEGLKQERGNWKARPDINCQAIAGTRANILYNIKRYAQDFGQWPLIVYTDALYYVSDEMDPNRAVPGILGKQNSLGGFKHKWTLRMDLARGILDATEVGLPHQLEALNDLAETRGSCFHDGCVEHHTMICVR